MSQVAISLLLFSEGDCKKLALFLFLNVSAIIILNTHSAPFSYSSPVGTPMTHMLHLLKLSFENILDILFCLFLFFAFLSVKFLLAISSSFVFLSHVESISELIKGILSLLTIFLKIFIYLFIYLFWLLGVLVAACGIFVVACMRDLVPQPGTESRHPALGEQSLTHWTTREVPVNSVFYFYHFFRFPNFYVYAYVALFFFLCILPYNHFFGYHCCYRLI